MPPPPVTRGRVTAAARRLGMLGVVLLGSASAATAGAAEPPVLPEPEPPSAGCGWYGEIRVTERWYRYNVDSDYTETYFTSTVVSSAPVTGEVCGARWASVVTLAYRDEDGSTDAQGNSCTRVYTTDVRGSGAGTGRTTINVSTGSPATTPYYLSAYGYAGQDYDVETARATSGCGGSSQATSSQPSRPGVGIGCDWGTYSGGPAVANPDVQAIVGSCTTDLSRGEPPGEVLEGVREYTWRVRRTQCDTRVDTDADGLADCSEYDRRTDPSRPDTDGDGVTDAAEVQKGLDPLKADSDGDGVPDATEVDQRTTPADAATGNQPPPPLPTTPQPVTDALPPTSPVRFLGARRRGAGAVAVQCGIARFDWYHVTGQRAAVRRGDRVCAYVLSSETSRALFASAIRNRATLSRRFASDLKRWATAEAVESAAQSGALQGAQLVFARLVPVAAATLGRVNAVYTAADVLGRGGVAFGYALASSKVLTGNSCVGFTTVTRRGVTYVVDFRYIFGISDLKDPRRDAALSVFSTRKKEPRRLGPDDFVQKRLGVSCGARGVALAGPFWETGEVLASQTRFVGAASDFKGPLS